MVSNVQSKLLLEAAQRYAQAITPLALGVLDERGISEEVAARFQLGTITEPINGHETYEGLAIYTHTLLPNGSMCWL
jgi:hypothetical protein